MKLNFVKLLLILIVILFLFGDFFYFKKHIKKLLKKTINLKNFIKQKITQEKKDLNPQPLVLETNILPN